MSDVPRLRSPVRPFARALVVVAHPDDAEFGGAATVARWRALGTEVSYLVVTDGSGGGADPSVSREHLASIRVDEQRAACAELGVEDVTFLGYPDGFLETTIDARRAVAKEIRRHRPEAVVTMDPSVRWLGGYVNHPDHRACGDLVLHSLNPAATSAQWDKTLLDEGFEPWDVSELWLMSFGAGPDRVEITEGDLTRKVEALRCHTSQLGDWDPEERVRRMAQEQGEPVGVGLAESFTVLRIHELEG